MSRKNKTWMRLVLLAVFLISTGLLVGKIRDGVSGSADYEQALEIAHRTESVVGTEATEKTPVITEKKQPEWVPVPVEEEDPYLEELKEIDLNALRQVNPDVIGWILLPDTDINYPILQGTDNEYYLNNTWLKEPNAVGSIFMEHRNLPDFTEYNTILYGHNMINGSMFSDLRHYTGENFHRDHPYVYIVTDGGVLRYEVFSAYQAELGSTTYGLSFRQEETKKAFLIHALSSSKFDMGMAPELTDRILTLSTCSGTGSTTRWVVHARLKMMKSS